MFCLNKHIICIIFANNTGFTTEHDNKSTDNNISDPYPLFAKEDKGKGSV